jgi:hypothetical protein
MVRLHSRNNLAGIRVIGYPVKEGLASNGRCPVMVKSENHFIVERHGCIVCARIIDVLAVYTPDGRLVGCTATSPGGHCLTDERRHLAACDTHTAEEIDAAYKRWKSRNEKETDNEQEDE